MISLNYGQLKKFIITKGESTITIDSDGNCSYDSSKLIISESDKGNINYSLNSIPKKTKNISILKGDFKH